MTKQERRVWAARIKDAESVIGDADSSSGCWIITSSEWSIWYFAPITDSRYHRCDLDADTTDIAGN